MDKVENAGEPPVSPAGPDPTKVTVAVRVRPLIGRELVEGSKDCVQIQGRQVVIGTDRSFTFDNTFSTDASQADIFETCVVPLVHGCFQGYNATLLAYGQTGSGKTFTMGTAALSSGGGEVDPGDAASSVGVIPRAFRLVLDLVAQHKEQKNIALRVSFVEIHNEEIKDLLNPVAGREPGLKQKPIAIREGANGSISLVGAHEDIVESIDDLVACLDKGSMSRTTGSTNMNVHSSRSHAIFTLTIEQSAVDDVDDSASVSAKFHFVDLAGSERVKRTQTEGERFKEGVNINQGLLALGNVISALGDEKRRAITTHVPYRDSKLTRLLTDSLGGNSRTTMIACVSPADSNFEETLNTLKYANRARNIKNKPTINHAQSSPVVQSLRAHVERLQLELLRIRTSSGDTVSLEELLEDESNRTYLNRLQTDSLANGPVPAAKGGTVGSPSGKRSFSSHLHNEIVHAKVEIEQLQRRVVRVEAERDACRLKMQEHGLAPLGDSERDVDVLTEHLETIRSLRDQLNLTRAELQVFRKRGASVSGSWSALPVSPSWNASTPARDGAGTPGSPWASSAADTSANLDDDDDEDGEGESLPSVRVNLQPGEDGRIKVGITVEMLDHEVVEAERAFSKKQAATENALKDIDLNISLKEQLVAELSKTQAQFQAMKLKYEDKLRQMETDVKVTQAERDKVLRDLETAGKGSSRSNDAQMEANRDKLTRVEAQLARLKREQKEQQRMLKMKADDDAKVTKLRTEIDRMKRERVELRKKARDESITHRQWVKERNAELLSLKKQERRQHGRITALQNENERQKKMIERMMNDAKKRREVESARYKPRPAGRGSGGGGAQGGKRAGLMSLKAREEKAQDRMRKWLSEEMTKHARYQGSRELLQKAAAERDSIVNDLEVCLQRRRELEMERDHHARVSSPARSRGRSFQLPDPEDESAPPTSTPAESSGVTNTWLGAAELAMVEEKIESLSLHSEYKATEINQAEAFLQGGDPSTAVFEHVQRLLEQDARAGVAVAFEMLCDHQNRLQTMAETMGRIETRREELDALVAEHEGAMRMAELKFDQQMTKLQNEHEKKVLFLLQQMESGGAGGEGGARDRVPMKLKNDQIAILTEHNEQYQEENESLQAQLDALTETYEENQQRLEEERDAARREKAKYGELVARFEEAAEMESAAPGIPKATFSDLNFLWDVIGVSADERAVLIQGLSAKMNSVCASFVREYESMHNTMQDRLDSVRDEVAALGGRLGDVDSTAVDPEMAIAEQLELLEQKMSRLRIKHEERQRALMASHERLRKLWAEMGVAPKPSFESFDGGNVSATRLEEYEREIRAAVLDKATRESTVRSTLASMKAVATELGTDYVNDTRKLAEQFLQNGQAVKLKDLDLARLEKRFAELNGEKDRRMQTLEQSRTDLHRKMSALGMEDSFGSFVASHGDAVSLEVLGAYKAELSRLGELGQNRMRDANMHLEHMWDQVGASFEERDTFCTRLHAMAEDEQLVVIEAEMERVNSLLEVIRPIIQMIGRREKYRADMREFEEAASNPKRLQGSSRQLLREASFREEYAKRYPKLCERLRRAIEDHEGETKEHFMWNGVRYLDTLNEQEETEDKFNLRHLRLHRSTEGPLPPVNPESSHSVGADDDERPSTAPPAMRTPTTESSISSDDGAAPKDGGRTPPLDASPMADKQKWQQGLQDAMSQAEDLAASARQAGGSRRRGRDLQSMFEAATKGDRS